VSHHIVLAGPAAETTKLLAYWVLAIISVAAALGMVLARKAVHCAMLLAVVMLSLAVMYATPVLLVGRQVVYAATAGVWRFQVPPQTAPVLGLMSAMLRFVLEYV